MCLANSIFLGQVGATCCAATYIIRSMTPTLTTLLGKEKKNAVASLLEQVIRHLLLLQYWTKETEYNTINWQEEIYNFRTQLRRKMTANLRNYLEEELNYIYEDALGFVKIKTANTVIFPSQCPYSLEQLLDRDWLP